MTLRLGTRRSALALAQSRQVATTIKERLGRDVELVEIVTPGDRSSAPVAQLGVGVFVSALREALAGKEIDLAVHSYKDLPTPSVQPGEPVGVAAGEGLVVVAVPTRADPRDALVARDGRTLAELPPEARVGTGSPRRVAQLRALGRRLVVVPLRGNVDTRLRKVADGEVDAVVLARAGLSRLGRDEAATEVLDPMLMLPAPAQGALAVECREGDEALRELLARLDDPLSHAAVTAERSLLAALQAGCSTPVGALAEVAEGDEGPELYLRGGVFSPDGVTAVRLSRTAPADDATLLGVADRIGRELAADLLAEGAETVLGVHDDPQP